MAEHTPRSESFTQVSDLYARPDWARRINLMGDSVADAADLVPLDAEDLEARAMTSTGLSDFGDFDGDWRARFRALIAAFEETARLHTVGRLITRQELLRGLRTRLLLTRVRAEQPAIADESIDAPIVITGPPRSGTSILFELLSLDPAARGPLAWEALHPVPFGGYSPEDRRRLAECEQEFWADVQPEFAAIHELRSDLPVECITLTLPGFSGGHWSMVGNIPDWVPDMPANMAYHRAALQTLQHGSAPRTWVLKTPMYLAFVDLVFATYPDAWVVHTHRDPLKTIPSGASTLAMVRWQRSEQAELPDPAAPGMGEMMIALMHRRANGELPDRIVDSHFQDLMADPAAAIEALYDQMDRTLSGEHADAIRRYVARRPKGRFGTHSYSPEQWGFDAAEIRKRTTPYTEYYGVALEG